MASNQKKIHWMMINKNWFKKERNIIFSGFLEEKKNILSESVFLFLKHFSHKRPLLFWGESFRGRVMYESGTRTPTLEQSTHRGLAIGFQGETETSAKSRGWTQRRFLIGFWTLTMEKWGWASLTTIVKIWNLRNGDKNDS